MRSGAGGAESLVLGNQAKRSPILGLSRADTQQPCTVGRGDRACWEVMLEGHPELGRLLTLSHRDLRGRKVDVLGRGAEEVISPLRGPVPRVGDWKSHLGKVTPEESLVLGKVTTVGSPPQVSGISHPHVKEPVPQERAEA